MRTTSTAAALLAACGLLTGLAAIPASAATAGPSASDVPAPTAGTPTGVPYHHRGHGPAANGATASAATPARTAQGTAGAGATIGGQDAGRVPGSGFAVRCTFSHAGAVDPIVMPGMAGMSHLHEFFGNTGTDQSSTGASLLAGSTTCDDRADRSAYWVPALYQDGQRVAPRAARVHYDVPPGLDVAAFPAGFAAVSGRTAQTAAWACVTPGERPTWSDGPAVVPACGPTQRLMAEVRFGDCWDGVNLDSPNHAAHLAFSERAAGMPPTCPATHPVRVPRVRLSVEYPAQATGGAGVSLASGDASTLHADIFEAWDPGTLEARIASAPQAGPQAGQRTPAGPQDTGRAPARRPAAPVSDSSAGTAAAGDPAAGATTAPTASPQAGGSRPPRGPGANGQRGPGGPGGRVR